MGTPVGSSILNRYYATARSGAYAEAAADLAVAVIPAALKRSAARRRLWAPIHGVALSVPEFRLADDTAIRELSDADVADIQSDPDLRFAGHEERHAMELRAVVLHEYAVPLSGPLDTSPALRRVEALVTTMRLLTGHRATLFSSNDYSLDPFLDATSSLLLAPERSTPADGVPIVLSAQILNSLRATWPAVQSLAQNHPNLALALKRFDSAMTRSPAADRLLDAWIGLEALFLSESNAELSYRASIRIPAYLGGSTDERLACHKMVKDSYSLRSKIVHGNPASAKLRPEQTQLVEVTVDLLRRSLLRAVTEGGLDAAAIDRRLLCGPEAGMR